MRTAIALLGVGLGLVAYAVVDLARVVRSILRLLLVLADTEKDER